MFADVMIGKRARTEEVRERFCFYKLQEREDKKE